MPVDQGLLAKLPAATTSMESGLDICLRDYKILLLKPFRDNIVEFRKRVDGNPHGQYGLHAPCVGLYGPLYRGGAAPGLPFRAENVPREIILTNQTRIKWRSL